MGDIRIVLGLLLAVFVFGLYTGSEVTENKLRVLELKVTQNQLAAVSAVTAEYNRKISELRKINDETITKLESVEINAVVTSSTGDSLQQQFTDSLCEPGKSTSTTDTIAVGATEATSRLVHSYVFGIVNQRAITYAKIADESRVRGLACEAEYDAVVAVRF